MTQTMWRYLVPVGVFAALLAFFYIGLGRDKETLPSALLGKPAPAFELPSVEDPSKMVSSKDFAGRKYVLNVWGTWCPGCRQEHDVLLAIAKTNAAPIVGLDWKDDLQLAQRWLSDLGNPYVATAFDAEGRVAIDWGVYGAPETFLVDEQGQIIHKHIGPMTMDIWRADFAPKLAGQGSARE